MNFSTSTIFNIEYKYFRDLYSQYLFLYLHPYLKNQIFDNLYGIKKL